MYRCEEGELSIIIIINYYSVATVDLEIQSSASDIPVPVIQQHSQSKPQYASHHLALKTAKEYYYHVLARL